MEPTQDYSIFQQIGSAFQQFVMKIEQEIAIATQTNFMDKMRQKGMIVGLSRPAQVQPSQHGAQEDERLAEQAQKMISLMKAFQAESEQHANHVTCRMHDFRCYLISDNDSNAVDYQVVYLRARDCINQALGDLILLKEQTKEGVAHLTLNESDAARMFSLFDALEESYNELTTDMQVKLRLLNAALCH